MRIFRELQFDCSYGPIPTELIELKFGAPALSHNGKSENLDFPKRVGCGLGTLKTLSKEEPDYFSGLRVFLKYTNPEKTTTTTTAAAAPTSSQTCDADDLHD